MAFLDVAGGAVLGGAISAATTWLSDRRRAQAEDVRAAGHRAFELRRAARVVVDELRKNRNELERLLEHAAAPLPWPPYEGFRTWQTTWDMHKETLAGASDQVWDSAQTAYNWLYLMDRLCAPGKEWSHTQRNVTRAIEHIQTGERALLELLDADWADSHRAQ